MTILCPQCGAALAERCPHCKRINLLVLVGPLASGRQDMLWCDGCHHFSLRGQGGQALQLCAECLPQQTELLAGAD